MTRSTSNFSRRLALTLLLCFSVFSAARAQDDLLNEIQTETKKPEVMGTFAGTRMVNLQTTETIGKNVLEFRVTHRFGEAAGTNGGGHRLFGLDASSDIRIGLEYGILNDLMVGFGRSKVRENLDLFVKYRALKQKEGGFPFSLTVFASAALSPEKNNEVKVSDEVTIKTFPKFDSRMSYVVSLILAKKVGRFSFLLSPTLYHRNYIGLTSDYYFTGDENRLVTNNNTTFSLGAGLRVKVSRSVSLVAEYTQIFNSYWKNNPRGKFYMPLGVGAEFEVGGHVFQVNFTNAPAIIAHEYLYQGPTNWLDGGFRLGFNITRVFTPGKRIIKRQTAETKQDAYAEPAKTNTETAAEEAPIEKEAKPAQNDVEPDNEKPKNAKAKIPKKKKLTKAQKKKEREKRRKQRWEEYENDEE